jgi:predicted negative regulator of RcsB-dependent stress response
MGNAKYIFIFLIVIVIILGLAYFMSAKARQKKAKTESSGLGAAGSKVNKSDLRKMRKESKHLSKVQCADHHAVFGGRKKCQHRVEKNLVDTQVKSTAGLDLNNQTIVQPTPTPVTAISGSLFGF